MLHQYIKAKMLAFCGYTFFAYCVVPSKGGESLLSPHLERWNIVPDPFIIYKAMYNEVDHRTYHDFDSQQQWRPTFKWNGASSLSPYELSVIALIILLVIFMVVCILSFTYLLYHIIYTFCYSRIRGTDKFNYTNIQDVIENRLVNV